MPKPRIVLAMIVKDEAAIIEACLRRVLPYVDAWSIVDTGSSDQTVEVVERVMGSLPGTLVHRPWTSFQHNRQECLELCRASGCDYALILDADDEWTPLPEFSWPEVDVDAMEVTLVQGTVQWKRPQVLRLSSGWTYMDPVHAIPVLEGKQAVTHPLADVEIVVRTTGHRHVTEPVEKYRRDAEAYERLIRDGNHDPRYVFYCAQSHRDAGQVADALKRYAERARMGGWSEEVWYSHLQVALLADGIGAREQAITSLLAAMEEDPERAETFVELARVARQDGRKMLAHLAASAAVSLRQLPQRQLFVDRSAYQWRNLDELALATFARGMHRQSLAVMEQLLVLAPTSEHARIEENIEHCRFHLGTSTRPDDQAHRVLVVGAGRSGTGFLSEVMRRAGVESTHEEIYGPNTQSPRWRHVRFESSWLALPWLSTVPSYVMPIHLVRHPLANARSWAAVGMFDDEPDPRHLPYRRALERYAPGVLTRPTALERWLAYWVVWNEALCAQVPLRLRIEDEDARDGEGLGWAVAPWLGLELEQVRDAYRQVPKTFNHRGRRSVSAEQILELDRGLVVRAQALCERFGYELTSEP